MKKLNIYGQKVVFLCDIISEFRLWNVHVHELAGHAGKRWVIFLSALFSSFIFLWKYLKLKFDCMDLFVRFNQSSTDLHFTYAFYVEINKIIVCGRAWQKKWGLNCGLMCMFTKRKLWISDRCGQEFIYYSCIILCITWLMRCPKGFVGRWQKDWFLSPYTQYCNLSSTLLLMDSVLSWHMAHSTLYHLNHPATWAMTY